MVVVVVVVVEVLGVLEEAAPAELGSGASLIVLYGAAALKVVLIQTLKENI